MQTRIRIGKVARLPLPLREQLNARLRDGTPYDRLIRWLADQGHPGFLPVNLSRWRHGGYLDWLARQQPPSFSTNGTPPPSPHPAETVRSAFETWLYSAMQTMHREDWSRLMAEHPAVFIQLLQAFASFSRSVLGRRKQEHHEQRQCAQRVKSPAVTPPSSRSVTPNNGLVAQKSNPDSAQPRLILDTGLARESYLPKDPPKQLFSSTPGYREALSAINGM